MSPASRVSQSLLDAGVTFEEIGPREGRELLRRWRETYASEVHHRMGAWTHAGYDWHAFSWGFYPHQRGDSALAEYCGLPKKERAVYVTSGWTGTEFVFKCEPCRPVFRHQNLDVLVFPDSLEWTAAFPHEVAMGPYLARSAA